MTVHSRDTLLPPNLDGTIIDCGLEPFNLSTGVDRFASRYISVLTHDTNDITVLGFDYPSCSNNGNVTHLVVVNTGNIH